MRGIMQGICDTVLEGICEASCKVYAIPSWHCRHLTRGICDTVMRGTVMRDTIMPGIACGAPERLFLATP
jgi:hypothetical protein